MSVESLNIGGQVQDELLLQEYVRTGAAEALARIIERHADMVYSTCLRILGDPSQAEDAAQATFLALFRKRQSLPQTTVIATWLYFAAQNSARQIRRAAARRTRHEQEAAQMGKPGNSEQTRKDVLSDLDEALVALPAIQRDAVVLRYFYGLSEQEAADKLRCPVRTIHTRVSRALERLRQRFAQRGAVLSSVTLAALLSQQAVQPAPAGLTAALTSVCLGQAPASAAALSTAQLLLKAMTLAKLKSVLLVAALATCVCVPAGYLTSQSFSTRSAPRPADGSTVVPTAADPKPAPRTTKPVLISTFDFEAGVRPEVWLVGKIATGPVRTNNLFCLAGEKSRDMPWARVRLQSQPGAALFAYDASIELSFDYWVEEPVKTLDIWVWNQTQQKAFGRFHLSALTAKGWTRAHVRLAALTTDAQEKQCEDDEITELSIQSGQEAGLIFIDNVTLHRSTGEAGF